VSKQFDECHVLHSQNGASAQLSSGTESEGVATQSTSDASQDRRRRRRRRISPNSHLRDLLNEGRELATQMGDVPITPHANGALAKQLAAAKMEKEELQHQNSELQHQNSELQHQNSELQHQNSELQHQNSELQHQNSGLQHQNSELQHQNSELQHQNSELQHQNSELQHQNSELQHQNSELQHQCSELQHQCSELRHQCSELQHQCSELETSLQAAAGERAALEQAAEEVRDDLQSLHKKVHRLEEEKEAATTLAAAKMESYQAENEQLQTQLRDAQDRLVVNKEDLEEAHAECVSLRRSLARMREESGQAMERFDEELTSLQREHDEREAQLQRQLEEAELRAATRETELELELGEVRNELRQRAVEVELNSARMAVQEEQAVARIESMMERHVRREADLESHLAEAQMRAERLVEQFQSQLVEAEQVHTTQLGELRRQMEEERVAHGERQEVAAQAWAAERVQLGAHVQQMQEQLDQYVEASVDVSTGDIMASAMAADSEQAERVRELEAALERLHTDSAHTIAEIRGDLAVLRGLAQEFAALQAVAFEWSERDARPTEDESMPVEGQGAPAPQAGKYRTAHAVLLKALQDMNERHARMRMESEVGRRGKGQGQGPVESGQSVNIGFRFLSILRMQNGDVVSWRGSSESWRRSTASCRL
jgi:nuclear receptor co-repressor 1/SWI/SNF-related matrix-associated actin-dependent regulator of chromatin subfamily A protein 2/4/poly(rC)-binding protein 2/3/4